MEYIRLSNLRLQEHFSSSEAVITVEQQLNAVQYLYKRGITHRDIKPENILVELRYPNLNTKLSDFGLSNDRTQLKTFYGTKDYLAPEIKNKGTRYINVVDIWSLGVVSLEFAYNLPKPLRMWDARD